jgi:hypothetical protein
MTAMRNIIWFFKHPIVALADLGVWGDTVSIRILRSYHLKKGGK